MSNSKAQQIARNTGFLYFRMILVMVVTLYTSRVILRTLGFEDFGIYNVVGSIVTFLSFFQAALRNATFRYLAYELGRDNQERMQQIYSMAINTHLLLAIILFTLMEIGGILFLNNKLVIADDRLFAANWAYQFSLLTFCIGIIRTPFESNIIAHERMDFYALTSIVEVILKLVIVYVLVVVLYDKLIVYAALTMLVTFLLSVWYCIYCKNHFPNCRYKKYWDWTIFSEFACYSGWSLLVNGATITRTQCINIFFNMFLGVLANAAMGIANQVVGALNMFVTNFTQAFKPQIIKSWAAKDFDYFMKVVFSTSKITYFLLLWITIPVAVNIDYFLHVWLGKYPPMAPVFVLTILIYYLIDALQEPLVVSVHATGNLKFHQIMISMIVILIIPVAWLMLKAGCSGKNVLLMNAFANGLCAVCRVIYMRHLICLDVYSYFKKVLCPVMVVSMFAVPIPFYIARSQDPTWTNVIFTTIFSFVLTMSLCFLIGLDREEKKIIYSIPLINRMWKRML